MINYQLHQYNDLLTYIKWQYTHGIVFLYLSTCAELVESTLGHSGENVNLKAANNCPCCTPPQSYHGVNTIFLVPLCEGDNFYSECEEGPVKKSVHQKHLTCRETVYRLEMEQEGKTEQFSPTTFRMPRNSQKKYRQAQKLWFFKLA